MSADRELHADASDDNKLVSETSHCLIYRLLTETDYFLFDWMFLFLCVKVRPKVEFHTLLQDAGATKDVFTMKEVQRCFLEPWTCRNNKSDSSSCSC